LIDQSGINDLANTLVDLLAAALAGGDTFLPGTADYDDLFYKLVQSSTTLESFSNICTPYISIDNIRFWEAAISVYDNINQCLQPLSSSIIRAPEKFKIPTFVLGGSNKGYQGRLRQHPDRAIFATGNRKRGRRHCAV